MKIINDSGARALIEAVYWLAVKDVCHGKKNKKAQDKYPYRSAMMFLRQDEYGRKLLRLLERCDYNIKGVDYEYRKD